MELFSPYGNVVQGDLFCSRHINAIRVERPCSDNETHHIESYEIEKRNKSLNRKSTFLNIGFVKLLLWLKNNHKIFRVVFQNKYDIIIIGGGELMSPSFAFALSIWATLISVFQRKAKVILFGVGVTDAGRKDINRISRIIRCSDMVFVRDSASQCKMEKLYNKKAIEIPDVAFVNDFHHECMRQFVLFGITTIGRLLKHGYMYSSVAEYYNHLISEITTFQDKGYDVRLSYTSQEDFNACSHFSDYYSKHTGGAIELVSVKTLDDLIEVTQRAIIVVSPRMHGCILGQLSGAEVRPEIISEKMLSYKNKYLEGFDCLGARNELINRAKIVVEK